MLVQQRPPVKKIGMWWLIADYAGTLRVTSKVFAVVERLSEKEDGLRMGDYFDLGLYRSARNRDSTLVCWPETKTILDEPLTAEGLTPDNHSAFLQEVKDFIRPEHPDFLEVQTQKRRVAMEADMILVTPVDVYASLLVFDQTGADGAPLRDSCMTRFFDVGEGGIVEGSHCRFRETYSWSKKVDNGFEIDFWEEETDDFVGCTMFD
jgi:hypothetical protein